MIFTDWQIRQLIESTGCISPFDKDLINPASLDVLLGDEIVIESPLFLRPLVAWFSVIRGLIVSDFWNILNGQKSSDGLIFAKMVKGYRLCPGEFILACTEETFNLPDNITCEFRLKSSRAREGLGHALAVWVDPGFSNSVLTLELKNYSRWRSIRLSPGMKIGQLIFHHHYHCQTSYRETGRYNGDRTVQISKG